MSANLFDAVRTVVPTLTASQGSVLEALMFAPKQAASAGQMRSILGLKAVVQINGAMGQIGRKVFQVMGVHPDGLVVGQYEWWHILATGEPTAEHGFVWTLRNEVVRALQACGMSVTGERESNEVDEPEKLWEGAIRQVTVNAFERNPFARARCIKAYGAVCAVCEIDFGKVYGSEFATNCIHVHHLRTLASIALSSHGEAYEVDPVRDLRPVCPNCHAVMHKSDPPHSIDQVRAMLQRMGKLGN